MAETMFLGETTEYWLLLQSVLRKYRINTASELELALQCAPSVADLAAAELKRRQTRSGVEMVGVAFDPPPGFRPKLGLKNGSVILTFERGEVVEVGK